MHIARYRIGLLHNEMTAMKKKHLSLMDQVTQSYEEIIRDNRSIYDDSIQEFKKKSVAKLLAQQEVVRTTLGRLDAVEAVCREKQAQWLKAESRLGEEIDDLLREQHRLAEAMEAARRKHAQEVAELSQSITDLEAQKDVVEAAKAAALQQIMLMEVRYADVTKTVEERQHQLSQFEVAREAELERAREATERLMMALAEAETRGDRLEQQLISEGNQHERLRDDAEREREEYEERLRELESQHALQIQARG